MHFHATRWRQSRGNYHPERKKWSWERTLADLENQIKQLTRFARLNNQTAPDLKYPACKQVAGLKKTDFLQSFIDF
jgi:hypothetical protein